MNFKKDLKKVIKCKEIANGKTEGVNLSSMCIIQLCMILHYIAPRFTNDEGSIQLLADAYGREQPWACEGYYKRVRANFSKEYLISKIEANI